MAIHYRLRENYLLRDQGKYVASTHRLDPIELEGLVDQIVQRGSTVCRADILSVLDDYHLTIENLLLMGMSINTPTANFRTGIQGVFDGKGDSFDPSRHRLVTRVSPGARLRKALRTRAEVVKDESSKPAPDPQEYRDVASGTNNNVLTPGEGGLVTGRMLRFDPADPAQGVFFVAAAGSRTRAERIIKVRPSEVTLIAPALPAGTYTIEVLARINGADDLRKGNLDAVLTVS